MLSQKEFKCDICGENHFIIYNTTLLGPPEEISRSDTKKLKQDIYECANIIYIKGVVLVPLIEEQKYLEWINWIRVEKRRWNEFSKKISTGDGEPILEGELIFEIPQYEKSRNINVAVGFVENYDGFAFIDLKKTSQLGIDQHNGINNIQLEKLFERLYHSELVEDAKSNRNNDFSTNDIDLAISKMKAIEGVGVIHITNGKQVLFQISRSGGLEFFQDESDINILGIDIPIDSTIDKETEKELDKYKHIDKYRKGEIDGIILYQRLFKDDIENMKIEIYEIARNIFDTSTENVEFVVFKASELKGGLD